MSTNTQSILDEVADERVRQDEKWGVQNHQPLHWMVIIAEELGEAAQQALHAYTAQRVLDMLDHSLSYRTELVQLAACCVAAVESLDRSAR